MLARKVPCRGALVVSALCAAAVLLVWRCADGPVLLHTHMFAGAGNPACGPLDEVATGVTILNPFRSRAPERVADRFLRAASNGNCSPDLNEAACKYLITHTVRVLLNTEWQLVYRWDSAERIDLIYRQERPRRDPCRVFTVSVKRAGAVWEVLGFGTS